MFSAAEGDIDRFGFTAFGAKPGQGVAVVKDLMVGAIYVIAVAHEGVEARTYMTVDFAASQDGLRRKCFISIAANVVQIGVCIEDPGQLFYVTARLVDLGAMNFEGS